MILKPTVLQLCKTCGEHGHFRFPDGAKGSEFCSKEDASSELARLREEGKVTREEQIFLADCIGKARSLVETPSEAGGIVQLVCLLDRVIFGSEESDPDPFSDSPSKRTH